MFDHRIRAFLAHPQPYFGYFRRIRRLVLNWPTYYHARLVHLPEIDVRLRNDMRFSIRPRTLDLNVIDEVIRLGIYTPTDWGVRNPECVVDVGAHIGSFAVLASRIWPHARIFAFEPFDANYRLLMRNLSLNGCNRVCSSMEAVAGKTGRRMLRIEKTTVDHRLDDEAVNGLEVEATSLSELFGRHSLESVGLLKMDCEGAEYEILESLGFVDFQRIEAMALEVHETKSRTAKEGENYLASLLAGKGYQLRIRSWPDSRVLYAWKPARLPGRKG